VVHRMLARFAAETPDATALARMRPRIEAELASLGVVVDDDARSTADDAATRVLDAVGNTLADPAGRWLFDPSHTEAVSEWALTAVVAGGIQRIVIDRTFVADGVRWIVDFKTSRHQGGGIDAFLASERARHAQQLEGYARVLRTLDKRPIRLALYFPALFPATTRLHAWEFAG
ncbi:MAG TPA: PD-(D/E)XK nuclease family protein, partial [Casimicrobiaceae bacterium]